MSSSDLVRTYLIKLEGRPVSENSAYIPNRWARKHISDDTVEYKNLITSAILSDDDYYGRDRLDKDYYELTLIFYMPYSSLYFLNGNPKRSEPSNFIKIAQDAVFDALGFDDTYASDTCARKRVSPTDDFYLVVSVAPSSLESPVYSGGVKISDDLPRLMVDEPGGQD